MSETFRMVVDIPIGAYCATKEDGRLFNKCPLLHRCQTCEGTYYCAVVNYDTHLGEDEHGILKHDTYVTWYSCPSTYEEKLGKLLKEKEEQR